jgi:hypothetical protein
MNGKLTINCPAMGVHHVSSGLAQTDQLDALSILILDDQRTFQWMTRFPPTFVRVQGGPLPFHWLVDQCIARSTTQSTVVDWLYLVLPPERCTVKFDFHDGLWMDVASIPAEGNITLDTGELFKVHCTFPETKSRWKGHGLWMVDPVLATGTVWS